MLLGRVLTPPEIAAENSRLLLEAVRTNLLTTLWGSNLSRTALLVTGMMMLGVVAGARHYFRTRRSPRTAAQWAEATMTLFVLLSTLWFGLLSVGWPRYAYVAYIFALLLVAKLAWDIVERLVLQTDSAYPAAIVILIAAVLATNLIPLVQAERLTDATDVGHYIRDNIPEDAVIETWEWELGALSQHPRIHHPDQDYLFLAIRQFSHEKRSFDLGYDPLQVNPDYIVTGPFSGWTHIYEAAHISEHFETVAHIGRYRVYKAIGDE